MVLELSLKSCPCWTKVGLYLLGEQQVQRHLVGKEVDILGNQLTKFSWAEYMVKAFREVD